MLFAALTELKFGMNAEGKPPESIANPSILGKLVIAFDQRASRKQIVGQRPHLGFGRRAFFDHLIWAAIERKAANAAS